jgi:hypothetical protein
LASSGAERSASSSQLLFVQDDGADLERRARDDAPIAVQADRTEQGEPRRADSLLRLEKRDPGPTHLNVGLHGLEGSRRADIGHAAGQVQVRLGSLHLPSGKPKGLVLPRKVQVGLRHAQYQFGLCALFPRLGGVPRCTGKRGRPQRSATQL